MENSPSFVAHISQPKLEALLSKTVASSPLPPRVLRGEFVDLRVVDDFVLSTVRPTDDTSAQNRAESQIVRSRFVVGADGARSAVRKLCGIAMSGTRGLESFVSVHFRSPDLWPRMGGRAAMLYFVFNPASIACVVAHDLAAGEWVAQVPLRLLACPSVPPIRLSSSSPRLSSSPPLVHASSSPIRRISAFPLSSPPPLRLSSALPGPWARPRIFVRA